MTQPPAGIEHPIYPLIADFMTWLLPLVEKFPRSQRFVLGNRLLDSGYWCQRDLIRARKVHGVAKADALLSADVELEILRHQLRDAHELHCVSTRRIRARRGSAHPDRRPAGHVAQLTGSRYGGLLDQRSARGLHRGLSSGLRAHELA